MAALPKMAALPNTVKNGGKCAKIENFLIGPIDSHLHESTTIEVKNGPSDLKPS